MLNAVGLQNDGVEAFCRQKLPRLPWRETAVIANIYATSPEEFGELAARLDAEEGVAAIEVNVSCPNVKQGGVLFGQDPGLAAAVTAAVRRNAPHKHVMIKLSPNVTDIAAIARACEEAGADGISLINTLLGMRIDLKRRAPILANKMGGMSGPAVFPVALRMVYQVYEAVKIPIIGMGGVSSAEDVIEMMLAGATAVEIGAGNLTEPYLCRDVIAALPAVCEKYGIDNLESIIGGAHHG